jgi:hypothetical protein
MIDAFTSLYAPASLLQVLLLTGVLGGGCAWLTGRAIASTWRPVWHVVASMVLLGLALRFLHFALLGGELLQGIAYALDTLFLILIALAAYRRTRALQMSRQYYWLYEADGPFGWKRRPDAVESSAQD